MTTTSRGSVIDRVVLACFGAPLIAVLLTVAGAALGATWLRELPRDVFPDLSAPVFNVIAQHVLDAVVEAIDLVERGLGRQRRLHQHRALAELAPSLPDGVTIRVVYDQSRLVRSALGGVGRAVLIGAGLVVLVLFGQLGQRAAHPVGDRDGVGAELPHDAAAHHLAGQPVGQAAPHRRPLAHVGDVAQEHRRPAAHRHDGRGDVGDAVGPGVGVDRPLHRALGDEAAGGGGAGALGGVDQLGQRHAAGRHAIGVDLDLELAQVAAQPLDRGDAGHRQEPVLDLVLGQIAQRHQVGGAGVGLDRELEDLVEPAAEARQHRRAGAGR